MKRFIIAAITVALALAPATALARHGHKQHRTHKLHRVAGSVGTVKSFNSASGKLVIRTAKGGKRSGMVMDATQIACRPDGAGNSDDQGDDDANEADDQGDDDANEADDQGDDDANEADDQGDDDANEADDQGDDDANEADDDDDCDETDLVEGMVVRGARIQLGGRHAVWRKLKLAA